MNHIQLQMLVSSFVDGEVTENEKIIVLRHLEGCSECRTFIEQINQVRQDIRLFGEVDLPLGFSSRVRHIIETKEVQSEEWLGVEPLARNTFYIVAITVLMMFLLTSYDNGYSPGIADVLIDGTDGDSTATQVLLQPGDLSKDDLLYAVMMK